MKVLRASLIILTFTIMSGCASIVSPAYYGVAFRSTPSDADIVITNRGGNEVYKGKTPCRFELKAGADFFTHEQYLATITFDGYQPSTILVRCVLDEWYFGNIFWGPYGILGLLIIDPATGAMFRVEKENYNAVLNKLNLAEPTSENGRTIQVINYQDLGPDVKQYLTLASPALD